MPLLNSMKLQHNVFSSGYSCYGPWVNDFDLWILDLNYVSEFFPIYRLVKEYKGLLLLANINDAINFNIRKGNTIDIIEIVNRANGFIKPYWDYNTLNITCHKNGQKIPITKEKRIISNPYYIDIDSFMPKPKNEKNKQVFFKGGNTNPKRRTICEKLQNEEWYKGGIYGKHFNLGRFSIPDELRIDKLDEQEHLNELNESLISICPPGHTLLSRRIMEIIALKSVMLCDNLQEYLWLNKLEENKHYLCIDYDNIQEQCLLLINDEEKCDRIRYEAHKIYDNYYVLTKNKCLHPNMYNDIKKQLALINIFL